MATNQNDTGVPQGQVVLDSDTFAPKVSVSSRYGTVKVKDDYEVALENLKIAMGEKPIGELDHPRPNDTGWAVVPGPKTNVSPDMVKDLSEMKGIDDMADIQARERALVDRILNASEQINQASRQAAGNFVIASPSLNAMVGTVTAASTNQIVSVQPMSAPSSALMYMDFQYPSNKPKLNPEEHAQLLKEIQFFDRNVTAESLEEDRQMFFEEEIKVGDQIWWWTVVTENNDPNVPSGFCVTRKSIDVDPLGYESHDKLIALMISGSSSEDEEV
jgi:hypothetical protein